MVASPLWNDHRRLAALRADYRSYGEAGVRLGGRRDLLVANRRSAAQPERSRVGVQAWASVVWFERRQCRRRQCATSRRAGAVSHANQVVCANEANGACPAAFGQLLWASS
jgi:hypothetical protein